MRISFNAEKPFGGIVLELCGNRNVNKISAAASSKIEVKYAQNSVTDTLITLGSYMPDEDGKVEINLDQPIAVSHIFLCGRHQLCRNNLQNGVGRVQR